MRRRLWHDVTRPEKVRRLNVTANEPAVYKTLGFPPTLNKRPLFLLHSPTSPFCFSSQLYGVRASVTVARVSDCGQLKNKGWA